MGELALGNVLLRGPDKSLATNPEAIALNHLSAQRRRGRGGGGDTGAAVEELECKYSGVPISAV